MSFWVKNIAKQLTLLAVLLMVVAGYAHAQNNSANPYINSTQLYRVPMGDIYNNTVVWEISNPNYSGGTPITLTNAFSWISLGTIDVAVDSAYIQITFVPSIFENGGTVIPDPWVLTYSEYNGDNCIAVRSVSIEPTENLFYLTTLPNDSDCNSWTGLVWNNTHDLTIDRTGAAPFTVEMHKAVAHRVKEWSFNGTVSLSGTDYALAATLFTATTGSTTYGTWEISNIIGGNFTLTVTVSDVAGSDYTDDEVTFEANILGPAINDVDVTLEITNGQAVSGINYNIVTDDNGTGESEQTLLSSFSCW